MPTTPRTADRTARPDSQTWAPGEPDGVDDLAAALRPLVFQLYRAVRHASPHLQLSASQGSALATLVGAGPLRIGQLAEAEGVRLPSMTEIVARLERDGLVARRPDPDDRRGIIVEVTPDGMARYAESIAARVTFLRDRLARLSASDQAAIRAALPALQAMLDTPGRTGAAGSRAGVSDPLRAAHP
jgi:DNA-binding MarR family transcriptional regulator